MWVELTRQLCFSSSYFASDQAELIPIAQIVLWRFLVSTPTHRLLPCRSYMGTYAVSMIPMRSPEGNFDLFDFISHFCVIPNMT